MLKDDKAVLLRRLATAEAGAGQAAASGIRQAAASRRQGSSAQRRGMPT